MADIPAKAVRVDKIFRAACELPGCPWISELYVSYQGANEERLKHLTWHRHGNGENDGGEWSA